MPVAANNPIGSAVRPGGGSRLAGLTGVSAASSAAGVP
jgi:hypothetical protein